jgi:hypothetical protein
MFFPADEPSKRVLETRRSNAVASASSNGRTSV